MTKNIITKRVIVYETIGFAFVILIFWVDEIFNLPYYLFGSAKTPINWVESGIETTITMILSILIILLTRRFLKRIKYLEGFLHFCSRCQRIQVGDKWLTIKEFVENYSEADINSGLCPDCIGKICHPLRK